MRKKIMKNTPIALHEGQHEAIVSSEMFLRNQERRKRRKSVPRNSNRKSRIYPLTGVGKCWECWQSLGEVVNLRGSKGGSIGYSLYRCGAKQDRGSSVRPKAKRSTLENAEVEIKQALDIDDWLERHHTLKEDLLMAEVKDILFNFEIPQSWHRHIIAYTQHPDGLLHFQVQVQALRDRQSRITALYNAGEIDMAEVQLKGAKLQAQIDSFWAEALQDDGTQDHLLTDLPQLWNRLQRGEKKSLLKVMFNGLFFDGQGRLRLILAHSPFDRLLGLPEGGMFLEV